MSYALPIALILFISAAWTFGIAMWRPCWLKQDTRGRLLSSVAEGLICAVIWSVAQMVIEDVTPGEAIFNGVRAGVVWTVPAYLSRTRYSASLNEQVP